MGMDVSRRNVVKGAGVASLGAAALGAATVCSAARADEASSFALSPKYDVDVLVVGCGLAGLTAAIHAIELGVDPERLLVIEKAPDGGVAWGGSSMVCKGNFLLPVSDDEDAKQAYVDAIYTSSGNVGDRDLLYVLADNGYRLIDWLIDKGCEYTELVDYKEGLCQRTMAGDGNVVNLRNALEGLGGTIVFDTRAIALTTDARGICGVTACDADGYFTIQAKTTILCTGGILGNTEQMQDFIGDSAGLITSRTQKTVSGDGITMARAVGAVMAPNSYGPEAIYLTCSHEDNLERGNAVHSLPYGIAVNTNGQRFCDEALAKTKEQQFDRSLANQPACRMGVLADSKAFEDLQPAFERYEGYGLDTHYFDTIEEVAAFFGCDASALQATIDDYNAHVVDDHTEGLAVEKTAYARTIDTPPYYAAFPYRLASSLTYVGISADTTGHVVYADGTPIRHLYCAGEIIGGCFHDEYMGGSQQAKAAIFGYVAAEHAVAELA